LAIFKPGSEKNLDRLYQACIMPAVRLNLTIRHVQ
jgi:hypothetical protein